ncbi:MAG: SMC-Scp complex subunit ScpB [Promethearchaeota archaeon]
MSSAAKTRNPVQQFQYKRCIEAALFIAGSPISVEMLSQRLRDIPYDQIEPLILELIRDYQNEDTALEIYQFAPHTFGFQVRNHVISDPSIAKFTKGSDFTPTEVKTLAFLASNQPIEGRDVTEFLGSGCKKAMRNLLSRGFIQMKKKSYIILNESEKEKKINIREYTTTQLFADYFDVPNQIDLIKEKLEF